MGKVIVKKKIIPKKPAAKEPIKPIAEVTGLNEKPMGRPTKMTEDTVRKLEEAFSIGADVSAACVYANISRETYYSWIEKNKDLSDRFEMLREKVVLRAFKRIYDSVAISDNMATWLIERKRKNEFSLRTEVTGAGGGPIETKLTDKEKQEIDDLFKRNIKTDS